MVIVCYVLRDLLTLKSQLQISHTKEGNINRQGDDENSITTRIPQGVHILPFINVSSIYSNDTGAQLSQRVELLVGSQEKWTRFEYLTLAVDRYYS